MAFCACVLYQVWQHVMCVRAWSILATVKICSLSTAGAFRLKVATLPRFDDMMFRYLQHTHTLTTLTHTHTHIHIHSHSTHRYTHSLCDYKKGWAIAIASLNTPQLVLSVSCIFMYFQIIPWSSLFIPWTTSDLVSPFQHKTVQQAWISNEVSCRDMNLYLIVTHPQGVLWGELAHKAQWKLPVKC